MKYVALLRGINSGKNPMIKMELLRNAFEKMGFESVKTVIASGNVVFESNNANEKMLEEKIKKELPTYIGFQSSASVRTIDDLKKLIKRDPFKGIERTTFIRPYVSFLKAPPDKKFQLVSEPGFQPIGIFDRMICYAIDVSNNTTPNVMGNLDKEFSKNVTTRTWKTVVRIVKAAE